MILSTYIPLYRCPDTTPHKINPDKIIPGKITLPIPKPSNRIMKTLKSHRFKEPISKVKVNYRPLLFQVLVDNVLK